MDSIRVLATRYSSINHQRALALDIVVRLLVRFHVAGVWRQCVHYFQDDGAHGVLQQHEDAVHWDHGKTKTPRALNWPRHSVVVLLLLLRLRRIPSPFSSGIDEFLGVDDGSPDEYRAVETLRDSRVTLAQALKIPGSKSEPTFTTFNRDNSRLVVTSRLRELSL
ncbi:hypothetical protein K0M31_017901 [Melipona bicolor]|uniref:Uncharacterized protein n=1 Tax=Melipona bicolor TaxID=60889 RepID=A0AA40KSX3_9HYME|nr:hypothetical protein K0M31_017901 [Melipona bicolor]